MGDSFGLIDPAAAAISSGDVSQGDPFDLLGGKAQGRAEELQRETTALTLAEVRRQFDIGQERLEPFFQEAIPALELQSAFAGARGPEAQAQAFQQFQEDPGTEFLREQGLRLIDTGAAATGGLGGGERLRELTRFSQGLALQDLGGRIGQLQAISGTGQRAGEQLTGLGERFAGTTGDILSGQTRSIVGGLQAQTAGKQNLIGTVGGIVGGLFSDVRLKENIRKISELTSGLGWYVWDWTEEAMAIVGDQLNHGVLAHEAREKFPEAISEKGGFLTVDYGEIH